MSARKSRHSKSGRERRNRYGRGRPTNQKRPLPVVVVVCDDAKTAVGYFRQLQRAVRGRVALRVAPARRHGAMPDEVAQAAREEAERLRLDADEDDKVWALIDLESEPDRQHKAYEAARRLAGMTGAAAALSNPCFEVWTLAHLVDTGKGFHGCQAVVEELREQWRRTFGSSWDRKTQADYSKLMALRHTAVGRTRARGRRDPSWTQVWKVVEHIDRVADSQ